MGNLNLVELFRFTGVGIPPGVTVTNAFLQFTAASDGAVPVYITIRGEATNNASTLQLPNKNISNRLTTTKRIFWAPTNWIASTRGPAQRTVNIAPILTEIVGRPDWVISNAVAFIITNSPSGVRRPHSFDGAPSQAAVLYAEWDTGSSPPPQPTPAYVLAPSAAPGNVFTIFWIGDPAYLYSVHRTTNLTLDPLGIPLATHLPGDPSWTNSYTDTNSPIPSAFYSVGAESP